MLYFQDFVLGIIHFVTYRKTFTEYKLKTSNKISCNVLKIISYIENANNLNI